MITASPANDTITPLMALGAEGTLFIGTRTIGRVYAVKDGKVRTIASGLNQPNGVAFRDGALYVIAINRVLRYDNIAQNPNAWAVCEALIREAVAVAAGEGLRLWAVHHIGVISRTRSDRLGPLIATAALATTGSWRSGYAIIGAIMLLLTTAFAVVKGSFRARAAAAEGPEEAPGAPVPLAAALRQRRVWLQIAVFFLYTGLKLVLGQWSFTLNTEARGVAPETAGVWAGAYWGSIGVGRVVLGLAVDRVGADRLLRMATLTALLGSMLFAVGPAWPGAAGLMLAGLGLAPIYPTLMSRTPARLGPYTAHAIGFQASAAMVGGAVLPSIGGVLAARVGLPSIGTLAVITAAGLWLLHELLVRSTPPQGTSGAA